MRTGTSALVEAPKTTSSISVRTLVSVMFAFTIVVAPAATATVAREIELVGVAGAVGPCVVGAASGVSGAEDFAAPDDWAGEYLVWGVYRLGQKSLAAK